MAKRIVNGQVDIFGQVSVNFTMPNKKEKLSDYKEKPIKSSYAKASADKEKGIKATIDLAKVERQNKKFSLIDDILCCFKITHYTTHVAKGHDDPEQAPIYKQTHVSKMDLEKLMLLSPEARREFVSSLPITSQIELKDLMISVFK